MPSRQQEAASGSPDTLALPLPGSSLTRHRNDAEALSRAYRFPYPRAYHIQLQLMDAVFDIIEKGQVGLLESPTGTTSELCGSSLPETEPDWVVKHDLERKRQELLRAETEIRQRIAAANVKQRRERDRIARRRAMGQTEGLARRKRQRDEQVDSGEESDSFLPADAEDPGAPDPDDDGAFLSSSVRDLMEQMNGPRAGVGRRHGASHGWMRQTDSGNAEDVEPETTPRIIYASRTHSQLAQFVAEVRKTGFGKSLDVQFFSDNDAHAHVPLANKDGVEDLCTRSVIIGSRKQMCINAEVRSLGERAGVEAMNERCLEMGKKGTDKKRCQHLPSNDEVGKARMLDFRDLALGEVRDIEELVSLGREMDVCPYYAARFSARQAELVVLPYNLLLQSSAREALNITLEGSVVVVDEAHNLIDTILGTHTIVLSLSQLRLARGQVDEYVRRFSGRLKGENEVQVKLFGGVLKGLVDFVERWATERGKARSGESQGALKSEADEVIMTSSDMVERMGGALDQVNMLRLAEYLRQSKLARKVSGYAERIAAREETRKRALDPTSSSSTASPARMRQVGAISSMHAIEALVTSLANSSQDGRVILSWEPLPQSAKQAPRNGDKRPSTAPTSGLHLGSNPEAQGRVTLKYQLLNPSHAFEPILEKARAVVLAGGTMEPMSDFRQQLFPTLSPHRIRTFSCGHIIPPSNLLAAVVPCGPKGVRLRFTYESRNDPGVLDDLAGAISNFCNVVPKGMVVFLPSYGFLEAVRGRWERTGALARMSARKQLFYEPKEGGSVDQVLRDYSEAAQGRDAAASGGPCAGDGARNGGPNASGALLFAVVGAKLSEGINFSDDLARAVVMVGMPFANARSAELRERMEYVRKLSPSTAGSAASDTQTQKDAGQELYVNLCMRAVNQSIGRAVRHQNDYAALLLLDQRYATSDIRQRLPGWIRNETRSDLPSFGAAMAALGGFFRAKRDHAKVGG